MPDKEQIEAQMEIAGSRYEHLVEQHGFMSGTLKYYKEILGLE